MKRTSLGLLVALLTIGVVYGCDQELPSAPQTVEADQARESPPALSSVADADATGVVQACYDKGGDVYLVQREGLKDGCVGNHEAISWGVQGPPGPPGSPTKVAFAARGGGCLSCKFWPPTPLKFTNVSLNDGGGYDPATGAFTAPVAGVYSISGVTGRSSGERHVQVGMFLNGQLYAGYLGRDGGSSVSLRLQAGDTVWLEATSSYSSTYNVSLNVWDHFSGHLVYAD